MLALTTPAPFELVCVKTGNWWPIPDASAGDRTAARLGLKDYQIRPMLPSVPPSCSKART